MNKPKVVQTYVEQLISQQSEGSRPKKSAFDSPEKIIGFVRQMEKDTKDTLAQDRKAREESVIAARNRRVA